MSGETPNDELAKQMASAKSQVSVGAKYLHSKSSAEYLVTDLAFFSEDTNQIFVVYKQLYGDELSFARPIEMWNEWVEISGKKIPRFTMIK